MISIFQPLGESCEFVIKLSLACNFRLNDVTHQKHHFIPVKVVWRHRSSITRWFHMPSKIKIEKNKTDERGELVFSFMPYLARLGRLFVTLV